MLVEFWTDNLGSLFMIVDGGQAQLIVPGELTTGWVTGAMGYPYSKLGAKKLTSLKW